VVEGVQRLRGHHALRPKFIVTAPASTPAATAIAFTVTAQNPAGTKTTDTAFAGTVHFTSTDAGATLPADFVFVPADLGTQVFSATFATEGTQTITATDTLNGSIVGTNGSIVVSQAATITSLSTTCPTTFTEGQSILLSASVAAGESPTGSITFADDTDTLCGSVAVSGGGAGCQTPVFNVQGGGTSSVFNVTASYSGDAGNLASVSSPPMELTVLLSTDVLYRGGFEQNIANCPTH
jgi:Bacterial Ig-like domain (group 3)